MKRIVAPFLAVGMATCTILVAADDALPDQTLSDYKIGTTLIGEEVNADDLKGKVVVIEYWGTR